MPPLLELQTALRRSLLDRDDRAAAMMLAEPVPPDRIDIYRNTIMSSLTKALRLSYPAVHRLVGDDFFEAAGAAFIVEHPPGSAHLDEYGAAFPQFLSHFEPAAGLAYLPGVGRLEWAVSRAVHAADAEPIDPARLAAIAPEDQGRICFVPHPSVGLVRADHPVDLVWQAVLNGNDAQLAALELDAGAVHLLVQRLAGGGVDVMRLEEPAWRFAAALCSGEPLQGALETAHDLDASVLLADHLSAQRFIGFTLAAPAAGRAK